jgi:hypothetical protein
MLVCKFRGLAPSRRAFDKALLDEEWLVDFLDGSWFLTHRYCNGVHADGPAGVLLNDRAKDALVHVVESSLIDFESLQSIVSDFLRDHPTVTLQALICFCEISAAFQKAVGNARRAS